MQWYEILILSTLELISMFLIWNKFNKKVEVLNKKIFVIVLALLFTTFIFFVYQIDIGFMINYILLCAMAILLFKLSIKETIIHFLIIVSILASSQFIFTYILFRIKGSTEYSFGNGFVINMSIVILSILIKKFIGFNKLQQYFKLYGNYITLIIVNITGLILLLIYLWRINEDFVKQYIVYLLIVILLWEGLNLFFLYQSIQIKEQKKIIEVHEKYTPFLKGMVHEVRQKQHDFKNHLHTLYGLTQIENEEEAKKKIKGYLEVLIENIKPTDKLLNIKEPILNAIIYSKKALAEEKNILFELNFQEKIPEYPMQKYELVELLGNLLDNAIEAAEDTDFSENPKIVLTIGIKENTKIIIIKNTGGVLKNSNIDINKIFKRGFSTKKGKQRGYGLYNVNRIVNNYKGAIELSFENEYTVFTILFK